MSYQTRNDVTNKNNNVSFEGFNIYYHLYRLIRLTVSVCDNDKYYLHIHLEQDLSDNWLP